MFDTNEAVEAVDTNEAVEAVFDNSAYWNKHFSRYDEKVWKDKRFFINAVELGRQMERGNVPTNFVPSALSFFEMKQSAEEVVKAERNLVYSAIDNTNKLLEKLVEYAVRKSADNETEGVHLSKNWTTFDEDVSEACNFKFVGIFREDQYSLSLRFALTNELLSTAEHLELGTRFEGSYTDECGTDDAFLCGDGDFQCFSGLNTTSAMSARSATEQYNAYCAFNEKLQQLVTKLYTQ